MLRTKQKSSKLLSLLLSVLLVLSAVAPLSVGATDNTDGASENRGKISMVFLGTGDDPDPSATSFDSSTWTAGQEFWVGLTLNDCTKVDKVAYQAGKPSHFTNKNDEGTKSSAMAGITLVTAGFDYDSRYVTPVFYEDGSEVAWDKDNMSDAQYMLNNSFKVLPNVSAAGFAMQNMTFIDSISPDSSAYPTGITTGCNRILTQINTTDTRATIFGHNKDVTDAPVYISAMKFKLTAVPAGGTKIVAGTLNSSNFTISVGTAGQRWMAQWNEDRGTTPDENLKNHFDYTGNIDFFPAPKAPASMALAAGSNPTLVINDGGNLGANSSLNWTITYTDNATATKTGDAIKYYLMDTDTEPTEATPVHTLSTALTVASGNGKYLYASYKEGTTTVYKKVGQVTVNKTVKTVVPSSTAVNVTYGNTLKSEADKLTFTVTYSDDSTETVNGNSSDLTWKINMNQAPAVGPYTVTATYKGKASDNIAFTVVKKQITITSIANVTPTKVGGATEVSGTATGDAITATGLVGSDKITVTYKATYSDVSAESSNATVAIKDLVLANSAPSNNYTLSATTATGTGSVQSTVTTLESIAIATPPKMTGYTVGDALDLSALKVTVNTKVDGVAATPATIDYDAAGLSYKLGGTEITLPYTLKAEDAGKELTVVYTAHGATKEAKVTDKLAVAADAVNEVTIKTEPDNDKMVYEVNDTLDFSQLVVTLGYSKAADEDVNYADFASKGITVTVGDVTVAAGTKATPAMNGKPITVTCNGISATTTETLTINAAVGATPDPAVAAPDHKTNNIVVTLPADAAELEYAIVADEAEAPTTFTKFGKDGSVVFSALADGTALAADTEYDVYVRRAASGEVLASAAVKTDVKTFKNKITVLNKNGSELSVGYADDGEIATQNALHEIVEEPSRLQGYFTDADLTNDVVFPLTISADTTLYAKQRTSSGGGSGGGGWASTPTPTLALSHEKVSGHVGETAALRATLKDSTAKITWASDNEAVATVDEEGVVTFVSVGTAKITATAGTLKATAEVEVLEEGVEPPAEESLINEKYTGAYVYGYEDGTFGATREITRAEVVAMVSRLLKNPIDENVEYETNFSDVADGAWYKNYIGFLAQYGIVEGYSDGTFAPANKITRAEMTAILARAAKFQLTGSATSFSDVADGFWAKAYIATMADKGYVNGYEDGTFAPNRNITRAETVAILNRMLDDSEVVGSIVPADVDASYWAYNEIVKAMNDRRLK